MPVNWSLDIALKVSAKFLLAALFAKARRVDVRKFRVENKAILRLRPRKTKNFFRKQPYIRLLIYLKAIGEQK